MVVRLSYFLNLTITIVLVTFLLSPFKVSAEVQLTISNNDLSQGELFKLRFEQNLTQGSLTPPDFSPLNKDFEIISQNTPVRLQSSRIINGVASHSIRAIYDITLVAKKAGIVTIPSIQFGPEASTELVLQIKPNPIGLDDFQLELSQKPQKVYAGEPFMLSFFLFYRKNFDNLSVQYPDIQGPGVSVERLKDGSGQVNRNGVQYNFLQFRYLVTPSQEGQVFIGEMHASAQTSGSNPILVSRNTNADQVQVISLPSNAQSAQFVAKELSTSQQFDPEDAQMSAQDVVTRRIEMRAQGGSASLFGNFDSSVFEHKDWRVYSSQPAIQSDDNGGVIYEQTITYLPLRSGTLKLPEVSFDWFDTQNAELKTATFEGRTIEVVGLVSSNTSNTNTTTNPPASQSANSNNSANSVNNNSPPPQSSELTNSSLVTNTNNTANTASIAITVLAVLGWVVAFLFFTLWHNASKRLNHPKSLLIKKGVEHSFKDNLEGDLTHLLKKARLSIGKLKQFKLKRGENSRISQQQAQQLLKIIQGICFNLANINRMIERSSLLPLSAQSNLNQSIAVLRQFKGEAFGTEDFDDLYDLITSIQAIIYHTSIDTTFSPEQLNQLTTKVGDLAQGLFSLAHQFERSQLSNQFMRNV